MSSSATRRSPASSRKPAPSRRRRSSSPRPAINEPGGLRTPLGNAPRTIRRAFGREQAESLTWIKRWDKVLVWNEPHAQWFVGGKLNVSANCLDRHLDGPRRNKAALIWEGEPGDSRVLTYQMLHREVCKFANVLKGQGIAGRRPRDHLHADGPRGGHRHAGLRPHRRRPQRRLRRLQRRGRRRPQQRRQGQAAHHGRRRLAPRQGRAAQAERRCRPWRSRPPSRSASSSTAATSRST